MLCAPYILHTGALYIHGIYQVHRHDAVTHFVVPYRAAFKIIISLHALILYVNPTALLSSACYMYASVWFFFT